MNVRPDNMPRPHDPQFSATDPHAEKVARLRELAEGVDPSSTYTGITEYRARREGADALREYADLLEKSRQGVTGEIVLACLKAGDAYWSAKHPGMHDAEQEYDKDDLACVRAALEYVAPLLAAMPQSGKEGT